MNTPTTPSVPPISEAEAQALPTGTVFGYRFAPKLAKDLEDYLNTRPFAETDQLVTQLFETGHPDPIYAEQAVHLLVHYFKTKPPRKEAKPFLERLADPAQLLRYQVVAKDEAPQEAEPVPRAEGAEFVPAEGRQIQAAEPVPKASAPTE